ncbi:MAG: Dabb family protein [Akkermansiaceae bacterium]
MTTLQFILTIPLLSTLFCSAALADTPADEAAKKDAAATTPYRHVVLFKFKDSATKAQISHIEKEFSALRKKIPTVTAYEWGTNVSPENLDQGFTHCFIVSFKDKAGLKTYIPHPAHKAFVKELKKILDKVLVIDFVAKSH